MPKLTASQVQGIDDETARALKGDPNKLPNLVLIMVAVLLLVSLSFTGYFLYQKYDYYSKKPVPEVQAKIDQPVTQVKQMSEEERLKEQYLLCKRDKDCTDIGLQLQAVRGKNRPGS